MHQALRAVHTANNNDNCNYNNNNNNMSVHTDQL